MGVLTGRTFTLVGEFSLYQFEVKDLIIAHGGEVIDFVPPSLIKSVTVLIGGKVRPVDLQNNLKYQSLVGRGAKEMIESQLEDILRKSPDFLADMEERQAEERQVMLEKHQHYGEW